MTTTARCGQCDAPVEDSALFCARCGADVSGLQGEQATVQMTPEDRQAASLHRSTMRETLREATLGEYEILAELGRGGMATVFLAHDIALDRKVAIKVMAPHLLEGEGMAERFKLEARTAAQLSHPHIIPIYAVKETDTTLYFVMKFIEGRALDSIVKKMGPLPIPMVKDILTKVGQALGYAHRREVVHRDIKSGNIMIDEEGTPIVTDFGIAKVAQAQGLTMTGAAIGTPSYMSPEQCSAGEVTGASDQYSLGVLAFEMLTGKLPFTGDTVVSIMYKHCHDPLPPLKDFRPDCPPEVLETVNRMLAKDPADRWPSLEAAVARLGTHALSFDDPVRTQMIELAKEGEHREILARIKTPRSPIPVQRTRTTAGQGEPDVAPRPRRMGLIVAAVVALLLGAGLAAALLRPWEDRGPTAAGDAAAGEVAQGAGDVAGGAGGGAAAADAGGLAPGGPGGDQGEGGATPPGEGGPGGAAGDEDRDPAGGAPPETSARPSGGGVQPSAPAAAVPASLRVDGVPGELRQDDVVTLSATVLDARGSALGGRSVSWRSSDPSVARVSGAGVLTALAPGQAVVTASSGGASQDVRITVEPAAVASVQVSGPTSLTAGQSATLTAQPRSAGGSALEGRAVRWTSSDAGVARVSAEGVVTAEAAGSATISAAADGASGSLVVTVAPPAVDTRTALTEVIDRYARALESRDIDQVRRAYPGITADQERQLRQALDFMRDLRADLRVGSLEQSGDGATAEVSGTYTYYNASSRREEQAPVTFRAVFERGADGWRLVQTR